MAYTYDQVMTALKEADKAGHAEDATRLATIAKSMKQAPTPTQKNYALSDVPGAALSNAGSDVGDIASGFANVVAHPANALQGAIQLGSGVLSKVLPESVMKYAVPEKRQQAEAVANATGQHLANEYGSYENIKRTLAEHPVSALMDVSTVLGGGGALLKGAEEGSKLSKMADILNTGSKYTNPLTAVEKAVPLVTKPVGVAYNNLIGTSVGGIGADTLSAIHQAGKEGGTNFWKNLSGKETMTNVLSDAKEALGNIKKAKSESYANNMEAVKSDKTILDMQPILNALNAEKESGMFGSKIIKKNTVKTQQELESIIHDWASSDPATYHTPEGLDALKQSVGDVRDATEIGSNSRRIVDKVYHAVKNQIADQAPVYAKTMQEYSEASDLVKEIEKSLSLGEKASADTAMRKLLSLTRNNVQTNYGQRLKLAESLKNAGGKDIMPAIAGQAMQDWFPRGMIGQGEKLAALGAMFTNPAALLAAPLASPKIMGALTYGAGKVAGAAQKLGKKIPLSVDQANKLGLMLYQMNQNKEQQ